MSLNPLNPLASRYRNAIREKAIQRANTRILIAGRTPEDFSPEDLEVVVAEEEQKIKSEIRDKGLLAVLALFGLSLFQAMFNRLIKLTVAGLLWNRYGSMLLSTVLLFAWFWIVGMIHQDYLEYLALQEARGGVGLSFVLKWLAFIAGVAVYWLFNSFIIRRTSRRRETAVPKSGRSPGDGEKKGLSTKGKTEGEDPFDAIRQKEKLRSKADLLIERHEQR